jgi:hypothetical protein
MNVEQRVLRKKTRVLPGGKIAVSDPTLTVGESVEVILVVSTAKDTPSHSVWDILGDSEGHRVFTSAADVDSYLREERASWES